MTNPMTTTAPSDENLTANLATLRSHVTTEQAFIDKVEAGIADFEAGRTTDFDTAVSTVRRSLRPAA